MKHMINTIKRYVSLDCLNINPSKSCKNMISKVNENVQK